MIVHSKHIRTSQEVKHSAPNPRLQNKALLVPLDGTPDAERALPIASRVARRLGVGLHLVHVKEPSRYDNRRDVFLVDDGQSLAFRSPAEAYLDAVSERLRVEQQLRVTSAVHINSCVESALRAACDDNIEMIIMARKDRSWYWRLVNGSTTNGLVNRLPVPLLLVPGVIPSSSNGERPLFRKVLLSISGSPTGNAAEFVSSFSDTVGAQYRLLRVLPVSVLRPNYYRERIEVPWSSPDAFEQRREAWRDLGKIQKRLEQLGYSTTARVVFSQSRGEAVITEASGFNPDLIAVSWKRHLMPWWLRDGVPEYVMRVSKANLLIVPEKYKVCSLDGEKHVDQPPKNSQRA